MKKLIIAVCILAGLLVAVYVYVKGTPQYSLYQFKKSVQNHDSETAFKYLDIDSLVDNLANDVMNAKDINTPSSPGEELGQGLAKGLMTMMLPTLKEAMKSQIKTSITTSTESDSKEADSPISRLGKGSWSDFDAKVEGKMAIVTNKNEPDVKFKMVQTTEGHWRIAQLMIPKETVK